MFIYILIWWLILLLVTVLLMNEMRNSLRKTGRFQRCWCDYEYSDSDATNMSNQRLRISIACVQAEQWDTTCCSVCIAFTYDDEMSICSALHCVNPIHQRYLASVTLLYNHHAMTIILKDYCFLLVRYACKCHDDVYTTIVVYIPRSLLCGFCITLLLFEAYWLLSLNKREVQH